MSLPRYVLVNKVVGETPLECAEAWRKASGISPEIPLAYAGRLDPMASGILLVLIGDECKRQTEYHHFDKEYNFSVLLDVHSDSGDVLGVVAGNAPKVHTVPWARIARSFCGPLSLPYPHYSSRTVQGKPLHVWASEGRLSEITIPKKDSHIYRLKYLGSRTLSRASLVTAARAKIDLLPTVTDPRKSLGNDFRRPLVHASWEALGATGQADDQFTILDFRCIASSGTYMRSLAEEIAKRAGTSGLAYSIERTAIGRYLSLWRGTGLWRSRL